MLGAVQTNCVGGYLNCFMVIIFNTAEATIVPTDITNPNSYDLSKHIR